MKENKTMANVLAKQLTEEERCRLLESITQTPIDWGAMSTRQLTEEEMHRIFLKEKEELEKEDKENK